MMVGEKAADLIAGRTPLEPNYTPWYKAHEDMPLYAEGEAIRDHKEAPKGAY